jgi:hypothetical protein
MTIFVVCTIVPSIAAVLSALAYWRTREPDLLRQAIIWGSTDLIIIVLFLLLFLLGA